MKKWRLNFALAQLLWFQVGFIQVSGCPPPPSTYPPMQSPGIFEWLVSAALGLNLYGKPGAPQKLLLGILTVLKK